MLIAVTAVKTAAPLHRLFLQRSEQFQQPSVNSPSRSDFQSFPRRMHIRQVWSDRNDVHIRIKRLEKTAFQTCVDGNDLRFFPVKFLINLYGLTAQRRIHRKGPFRIIVFEAYLSMSCLCQYRHLIAHHLFQRAHRAADGAGGPDASGHG